MSPELISIRRLTDSDLGWFAAHRSRSASKQRAMNVNAWIAQLMLSTAAWRSAGVQLRCRCIYNGAEHVAVRKLWKVGKNWRLGGAKLEGASLSSIGKGDFALVRSPEGNDGTQEISLTFVTSANDPASHEWLLDLVSQQLSSNMTVAVTGSVEFELISERFFPPPMRPVSTMPTRIKTAPRREATPIPPIPAEAPAAPGPADDLRIRVRSPHVLSQMLKVSGDLSAEAHYEFVRVLERLSEQLRGALQAAEMISKVERNHKLLWSRVRGQRIAFVDGGMANLAMLGSAPIAVRVGGYVVRPGGEGADREQFTMVKHLIDELYTSVENHGVFSGQFPDPGALRDAARISLEAAGGVHIAREDADLKYLFMHGALVNPVSRYTDVMDNQQVVAAFPDFSARALSVMLPNTEANLTGRDANFVRVYLRQLQLLESSSATVCGVVERESQADSVYKQLVSEVVAHPSVARLLPKAPDAWAAWFIDVAEQFRITDSLLFRCVLKPGEYTSPVDIDRNDVRRAPPAWSADIQKYPRPWVSYLLPNEWSAPTRVEVFSKDLGAFNNLADLVMHCSWLLPRYAFPVGLDIADKFAKVPNWMTRPVSTDTAVRALRRAMDTGDTTTFDAMRRMLCGSTRDWLYRPSA